MSADSQVAGYRVRGPAGMVAAEVRHAVNALPPEVISDQPET